MPVSLFPWKRQQFFFFSRTSSVDRSNDNGHLYLISVLRQPLTKIFAVISGRYPLSGEGNYLLFFAPKGFKKKIKL